MGNAQLTDHFTLNEKRLSEAPPFFDLIKQAKQHVSLSDEQHNQLKVLRMRFEALKKKLEPEKELLDELLQELEQGQVKGAGRLQPLYDYVDNLKAVDTEKLRSFQRQQARARAGVLCVVKERLQQFGQGVAMTEDQFATLHRSFLCLTHLGDESDQQALKTALQSLVEQYLTHACNGYAVTWLVDAENVLLMHAPLLKSDELTATMTQFKQLREQQSVEYLATARRQVAAIELSALRQRAQTVLGRYETALKRRLSKLYPPAILTSFDNLVTQALLEDIATVNQLTLTPSQRTVLSTNHGLYFVDQWLWLKRQAAMEHLAPLVLSELITTCERRTATVLSLCQQATTHTVPATDHANPSTSLGVYYVSASRINTNL